MSQDSLATASDDDIMARAQSDPQARAATYLYMALFGTAPVSSRTIHLLELAYSYLVYGDADKIPKNHEQIERDFRAFVKARGGVR